MFLLGHATLARRVIFLQAASSGIHKFLGSVPLAVHVALQLDAGPMLLLPSFDRFHYGIFLRDLLMFQLRLHFVRI
jgi:hypothetical protein